MLVLFQAEIIDLDGLAVVEDASDDDLIAIDEALGRLAQESPPCAELVKLRFFAGLTLDEAAVSLGLARRTAPGRALPRIRPMRHRRGRQ